METASLQTGCSDAGKVRHLALLKVDSGIRLQAQRTAQSWGRDGGVVSILQSWRQHKSIFAPIRSRIAALDNVSPQVLRQSPADACSVSFRFPAFETLQQAFKSTDFAAQVNEEE